MNDTFAIKSEHPEPFPSAWFYVGAVGGNRWSRTPVPFTLTQASELLAYLAVSRASTGSVRSLASISIVPVEQVNGEEKWEPVVDPQNYGLVHEGDTAGTVDHFGKDWYGVFSRRIPGKPTWREVPP